MKKLICCVRSFKVKPTVNKVIFCLVILLLEQIFKSNLFDIHWFRFKHGVYNTAYSQYYKPAWLVAIEHNFLVSRLNRQVVPLSNRPLKLFSSSSLSRPSPLPCSKRICIRWYRWCFFRFTRLWCLANFITNYFMI